MGTGVHRKSDLVVIFPQLARLGVGLAQLGAGRPVVDRIVVVEHATENARRVGIVADRM